ALVTGDPGVGKSTLLRLAQSRGAYSGEAEQPFRVKADTDSRRSRTVVPVEAGQRSSARHWSRFIYRAPRRGSTHEGPAAPALDDRRGHPLAPPWSSCGTLPSSVSERALTCEREARASWRADEVASGDAGRPGSFVARTDRGIRFLPRCLRSGSGSGFAPARYIAIHSAHLACLLRRAVAGVEASLLAHRLALELEAVCVMHEAIADRVS